MAMDRLVYRALNVVCVVLLVLQVTRMVFPSRNDGTILVARAPQALPGSRLLQAPSSARRVEVLRPNDDDGEDDGADNGDYEEGEEEGLSEASPLDAVEEGDAYDADDDDDGGDALASAKEYDQAGYNQGGSQGTQAEQQQQQQQQQQQDTEEAAQAEDGMDLEDKGRQKQKSDGPEEPEEMVVYTSRGLLQSKDTVGGSFVNPSSANLNPNASTRGRRRTRISQEQSALWHQPPVPNRTVHESLALINSHEFVFVIGHHFSGTSLAKMLLELHPGISGLHNTRKPEDEGQHVQSVYKASRLLGGIYSYAFNPLARMTDDNFVDDRTRTQLFNEWSRYWDLNSRVLLEKSPRHIVMTRFLQKVFGAPHSSFVAVVRHPLGCARRLMQGKWKNMVKDCYRRQMSHWLVQHRALLQDATRLHKLVMFRYEDFLRGDVLWELQQIYSFLNLDQYTPNITVTTQEDNETFIERPKMMDIPTLAAGAMRKLLFFYGSREHITVRAGTFMSWVPLWEEIVREDKDGKCQDVVRDLEPELNRYGYSLVNATDITSNKIEFPLLARWQRERHQKD